MYVLCLVPLQKEAEQAKKEGDTVMDIEENGAHEQTAA